jgi:hypothetical protein
MAHFDYTTKAVKDAMARGENFHGYTPSQSLGFIVRNYRTLASLGILEAPWLDAYMHASHFNAFGLSLIEAAFDACDRARLRALKPLGDAIALGTDERDRITLSPRGMARRRA